MTEVVMLAGFHPTLEEEIFFPLRNSRPIPPTLGSSFNLGF